MKKRLCAFPSADLPDGGHVQSGPLRVLFGRLPAQAAQVCIQGVEATVHPGIGSDLLQLTPTLHESQAVRCTAHLQQEVTQVLD